ncbi:MAG TPA: hypothetical protein VF815_11165 [Myxococcaceae bacterium]
MECLKETEARPLAFPDMKTAWDWIERHKEELVVGGTIVLVAGVAFVVISGGAGAVVLVPLVAL